MARCGDESGCRASLLVSTTADVSSGPAVGGDSEDLSASLGLRCWLALVAGSCWSAGSSGLESWVSGVGLRGSKQDSPFTSVGCSSTELKPELREVYGSRNSLSGSLALIGKDTGHHEAKSERSVLVHTRRCFKLLRTCRPSESPTLSSEAPINRCAGSSV